MNVFPVVFGRMLLVKQGYKRLLWLERKEQEEIVNFKGGSLLRDTHRVNMDLLAVTLWYHSVTPKNFIVYLFFLKSL